MPLGKIVKSNSHIDYVCQIYNRGEVAEPPSRHDHMLGTFVRINVPNSGDLVGVLYDTLLVNPDFGRFGPRLTTPSDLAIFSPDFLQEQATLVGVMAIGQLNGSWHGVPPLAADNNAVVEPLNRAEIVAFHQRHSQFSLAYIPLILSVGTPIALHLVRQLLVRLMAIFPQQSALLTVLQRQLTRQTQLTPFGA